ncbi:MAG: hypothetical protein K8F24_13070 [Bacteroidales bacterium]|nr:hypothetical protein [Bacteroidales bacterium]
MKYSSKLNEFDILDLLNEYHSELRKLRHKVDFVKNKVAELEDQYSTIKKIKSDAIQEAKAEAVETVETVKAVKAEKEAPQDEVSGEKKKRRPYPLSEWDTFIMDTIRENNRATLSREIYEAVKEKAINAGVFTTDEKSKSKINQCLVKLTNRRDDLNKVKHKGRGYAYALPSWYDERNRLMKEYKLK